MNKQIWHRYKTKDFEFLKLPFGALLTFFKYRYINGNDYGHQNGKRMEKFKFEEN